MDSKSNEGSIMIPSTEKPKWIQTLVGYNNRSAKAMLWDPSSPLRIATGSQVLAAEQVKGGIRLRSLSDENTEYFEVNQDALIHGIWIRQFNRPIFFKSANCPRGFAGLDAHSNHLDSTHKSLHSNIRQASAIGLGTGFLIILLALFYPAPKPKPIDEIPAQYAKIVMTQQPKPLPVTQQAQSGGGTPDAGGAGASSVKKVALGKAVTSKAFQASLQRLIHSGLSTAALNSHDLAKTTSTQSLLTQSGIGLSGSVDVSSQITSEIKGASRLGGGGTSEGAGYGKGKNAGIAGQGKQFVNMNFGDASVEEGLSKEEVGKVIHAHASEIRYCYESSLLGQNDQQGKLILAFTIGGQGSVKTADVKNSTLQGKVDDCIVRRLLTWQFPKPKGGVDVAVSYPFLFKTLGR